MNNHNDALLQHTLAAPIHVIGRGLHRGVAASMTLLPAPENTGYVFERLDVRPEKGEIPARWNLVSETRLSTTISNSFGVRVATIEHLLAALRGMEVDNCRILIDGPEVLILDGSAQPYVELIEQTGLRVQKADRRAIVIRKPVVILDQDSNVSLVPHPTALMDVTIDFDNQVIGRQRLSLPLTRDLFANHIARARTFGLERDIRTLQRHGLALGGSLGNAILVGEKKVINEEGLRYTDEFVRHKYLVRWVTSRLLAHPS